MTSHLPAAEEISHSKYWKHGCKTASSLTSQINTVKQLFLIFISVTFKAQEALERVRLFTRSALAQSRALL